MIWNDAAITKWASNGGVTPFDPKLVNPASLDLRMGNVIREPHSIWSYLSEIDIDRHIADGTIYDLPRWGDPVEFDVFWLKSRRFVLCASLEFVNIPLDMATLLFSKSSTGRIGLEHLHAGLGDPGWHSANWTWELHNVAPWPIPLIAGKPVMQQVMIKMTDTPLKGYDQTGRYNGQVGPTPEREVKSQE